MSALTIALCQVVLTFSVEGDGPVRFGFPLRKTDLERGLRINSGAQIQWRAIQQRPDPETGRIWVELAVVGARGNMRLTSQSSGTRQPAPVVERAVTVEEQAGRRMETVTWKWSTGEEDRVQRTTFLVEHVDLAGEVFQPGESLTEMTPGVTGRWSRVRIPRGAWEEAGVLPRDRKLARTLRRHLVEVAARLPELPGRRGRGDYGRSGDVVTNLEFDTALGLGRLGLATGSQRLLVQAQRSAQHLLDRDMDPGTGLPFRHGSGHRVAAPETGHVWLQGLLLMGCVTADDRLIRGAQTIARGLARNPPREVVRARDVGWPLWELESWLRFAEDDVCAQAADATALSILSRYDRSAKVFRFEEGERRGGFYDERAWITGGILLPALRAHLQRRPGGELTAILAKVEARLLAVVLTGRRGLPVRYLIRDGQVLSDMRLEEVPEVYMVLEGLRPQALARCLGRQTVRRALGVLPEGDDPDLATSFSKVARCWWVLR